MDPVTYRTEYGESVPSCSIEDWCTTLVHLIQEDGLLPLQLVESISYSMAMVVRYALGLSASDGQVTVLVTDGFFSWSALATARHLADAGSRVNVAIVGKELPLSHESALLLKPLKSRDCRVFEVASNDALRDLYRTIDGSHNVICAIRDPLHSNVQGDESSLVSYLNESPVPVHSIGIPPGVSLATGEITSTPLYSSSTLSLGLPLKISTTTYDLIGRHYLADLQWDLSTYRRFEYLDAPLFREQPVIKLLPTSKTLAEHVPS